MGDLLRAERPIITSPKGCMTCEFEGRALSCRSKGGGKAKAAEQKAPSPSSPEQPSPAPEWERPRRFA